MKFHSKSQELVELDVTELVQKYPDLNIYLVSEPPSSQWQDPCVFVEEKLEANEVVRNVNSRKLHHLVQKNKGRFNKALISTGRLIQNKSDYFKDNYCFPDEKPLRELRIDFRNTQDKLNLKTQSLAFFEALNIQSLTNSADAIVEELYMNAMIDAPREGALRGVHISNPTFQMYFCQTKEWLQISCTDPFGSLDTTKFLTRMEEVYLKGAGQALNVEDDVGAGLGCVIIFEHSACLILGVEPGTRTKVTALLPLGVSNMQRELMKKSLHWFEL